MSRSRGPVAKANRKIRNAKARVEREIKLEAMKQEGKSCANCQHYGAKPLGLSGCICELDSDFYGYVVVKPTDLCTRHLQR